MTLPFVPAWAEPVWHLFVVRHRQRDELRERLAKAGVDTLIHYPVPPHRSGAYADFKMAAGAFPLAEVMADEVLSLPVGPHLSSAQADQVVNAMRGVLAGPVENRAALASLVSPPNMKFNGRNVYVSPKARIGQGVKIGDNCTIYDNVEVGDNSIICNDTVLGEPLNRYYHEPGYENPPTVFGPGALIRSHAIIYAGCAFGPGFSCGHRVTIREETVVGAQCSVGTLSDIQGRVRMGEHCKLHSNVHISQTCSLGNYVFLFPYVVLDQ